AAVADADLGDRQPRRSAAARSLLRSHQSGGPAVCEEGSVGEQPPAAGDVRYLPRDEYERRAGRGADLRRNRLYPEHDRSGAVVPAWSAVLFLGATENTTRRSTQKPQNTQKADLFCEFREFCVECRDSGGLE